MTEQQIEELSRHHMKFHNIILQQAKDGSVTLGTLALALVTTNSLLLAILEEVRHNAPSA
jgi:hypothetical protein